MTSRDLIKKLGGFLADLTSDRPPARIHADLSQRADDPQIGEVYQDVREFTTVWTALRHGATLPDQSWVRLVLPTVAFYSGRDAFKANMEMALHMWRTARDAPADPLPPAQTARLLPAFAVESAAVIDAEVIETPAQRKRSPWRWVLPLGASIIAVAVAFLLTRPAETNAGPTPSQPVFSVTITAPIPSMEPPPPSVSPSASPVPPKPSPIPTWSATPVKAPTPPQNLRVVSKTKTSVALAWDAPADMGSGGFEHYRIFRDGVDIGPTVYSGKTVAYLKPATSYAFLIRAYNKAGSESPPSNSVAVTTDPLPPPTISSSPSPAAIPLGPDFLISGMHIPCSAAATMNIYLRQQLVFVASVNNGSFEAPIDVIEETGDYFVKWLPTNDLIQLSEDNWEVRAELPSQPQCAPMVDYFFMITFTKVS